MSEQVDLFDLNILSEELCTCALPVPGAVSLEEHEPGCRYRRALEKVHPCLPDADAVREWRSAVFGAKIQ